MVVIFKIRCRYAKEGLPSDEFKDKTAKPPDIKRFVDSSSENELRSSKAERGKDPCRRFRGKKS